MFVEIAGGLAALILILLIGAMTMAMDSPKPWVHAFRGPGRGFLIGLGLFILVVGVFLPIAQSWLFQFSQVA